METCAYDILICSFPHAIYLALRGESLNFDHPRGDRCRGLERDLVKQTNKHRKGKIMSGLSPHRVCRSVGRSSGVEVLYMVRQAQNSNYQESNIFLSPPPRLRKAHSFRSAQNLIEARAAGVCDRHSQSINRRTHISTWLL